MNVKIRVFPVVLVAVLLFTLVGVVAVAQKGGGWVFLGQRAVTDRLDHDTIVVTGAQGTFKALKLRVFQCAVQFHKMVVHYGNGERDEVEVREIIPAGGWTRAYNLTGVNRVIARVDFWYDSQSLQGKKGVVRLFGLK